MVESRGSMLQSPLPWLRPNNLSDTPLRVSRVDSDARYTRRKCHRLRRIASIAGIALVFGNAFPGKGNSNVVVSAFTSDQISPHLRSSSSPQISTSSSPHTISSAQTTVHTNFLKSSIFFTTTCLRMASAEEEKDSNNGSSNNKKGKKKKKPMDNSGTNMTKSGPSDVELELLARVTNLEQLVARQSVEIRHLKQECKSLTEAAAAFAQVVEMLRQAGLSTGDGNEESIQPTKKQPTTEQDEGAGDEAEKGKTAKGENKVFEYFDDHEIFGTAPSSVIDAADSAGAAILAALLGGKQRMLVDVRDAELSRDQETLVQFIELAILPVAAGLQGLKSTRNRVKIVFPTVSQLLQYRRAMVLAAPEVVALSTLGFDPVEKQDILVVLIAPSPDDEEGLLAMNELLFPTDPARKPIRQPTVVLNHHMVPVAGPAADFEVAYHLRLLSVQYMTGDNAPEYFSKWEEELKEKMKKKGQDGKNRTDSQNEVIYGPSATKENETLSEGEESSPGEKTTEEDEALEAAMKHAYELGVQQGVTRAMVIRAYPRPWHVFVDTSPDTDADFEVAATFDEEPTQDDVNFAIVECLEGSEREDELVAQQMQQALEDGQLDRVSEMLGISTGFEVDADSEQQSLSKDDNKDDNDDDDDDDDNFYNDFDMFEEDSC